MTVPQASPPQARETASEPRHDQEPCCRMRGIVRSSSFRPLPSAAPRLPRALIRRALTRSSSLSASQLTRRNERTRSTQQRRMAIYRRRLINSGASHRNWLCRTRLGMVTLGPRCRLRFWQSAWLNRPVRVVPVLYQRRLVALCVDGVTDREAARCGRARDAGEAIPPPAGWGGVASVWDDHREPSHR